MSSHSVCDILSAFIQINCLRMCCLMQQCKKHLVLECADQNNSHDCKGVWSISILLKVAFMKFLLSHLCLHHPFVMIDDIVQS
ncbi:hypothetical protein VNO78_37383 [Psophocarpus tetragonolobus]|uniref:Uncharacterized protein n=1 Tax=Psophocarpus tetragonolobus TaxID=3891 RepID=A0AAN9RCI2_PSOTE